MAADDLATQGASASTAMVLKFLFRNILVLTAEGLNCLLGLQSQNVHIDIIWKIRNLWTSASSAPDKHICFVQLWWTGTGKCIFPTKEPCNYREPSGDWTHFTCLHTEATSQAASCPARSFRATETVPKNTARCGTGQLTIRLKWTGVNFNKCVC